MGITTKFRLQFKFNKGDPHRIVLDIRINLFIPSFMYKVLAEKLYTFQADV